jgi:hypothetical protein
VVFLSWTALSLAPAPEAREKENSHNTFLFHFENDYFVGSDQHYTNAFLLTWLSQDLTEYDQDTRLPRWGLPLIGSLPFVNRPGFQRNVGLSIGQTIYTPENISTKALIRDDRPYAGWSYFSLTFHVKNAVRLDTYEITAGVVGPYSMAEETQKTFHKWFNSQEPKGWDNQLRNEPGLVISWQRNWRLVSVGLGDGFGVDFIPRLGGAIGNVATFADIGGQVRLGLNIPVDFGTALIRPGSGIEAPADPTDPRIRPRRNFGVHLFADVEGRAVARNIFLDGNTWKDSHSVDKLPLVADLAGGLALVYRHMKLSFAYVYRTREFHKQDLAQPFGSVTLGLTF